METEALLGAHAGMMAAGRLVVKYGLLIGAVIVWMVVAVRAYLIRRSA